MIVKYIKVNPTGNKTLLVETQIPHDLQPEVARILLRADPDAEQVGFLEPPCTEGAVIRLQMMGGEFCGNASMSAAARVAEEAGIKPGKEICIPIEVSGVAGILKCIVWYDGIKYVGKVTMPLPEKITDVKLEYQGKQYNLNSVFLPGITHLIIEKCNASIEFCKFAESAIKLWSKKFKSEAVGLIIYNKKNNEILPLVYVKSTDSLFWERGCGSGSAAIGAYIAGQYNESQRVSVKQPGGTIVVEVQYENCAIKELTITGEVLFESEVSIDINLDA